MFFFNTKFICLVNKINTINKENDEGHQNEATSSQRRRRQQQLLQQVKNGETTNRMTTDDNDCELEYTHDELGGKGSTIQTNEDLNNSSLAAT
jgi:hypothetical protein